MPFSGPNDPKLPDRIKDLSAVKRRAFVGAFNSAIEDDPDDESKAFRIANSAANRAGEKAIPDEQQGAKHDALSVGGPVPVVVVDEVPDIWGGVTSFAELDRIKEESTRTSALQATFFQFGDLVQNALRSEGLTPGQKVERVRSLVEELGPRIDSVARDPQIAFKDEPERGSEGWRPWTTDPGGFAAFKDAKGDWRWVAIHTNRYEDVAGEIFSDEAHKAYVEWVEDTGQRPPLRFWHVPVDLGPSDFLDYSDGFMVSSGTFYDDRTAEALSGMKDLGCSHGYHYRSSDLRDGVYHAYRSFEVSVLPVDKAANRLTQFIAGEAIPVISEEKRPLATEIFGEEGVKKIDDATAGLTAAAAAAGLRYKDLTALTMPEGNKEDGMSDEQGTAPAAPATTAAPPAAEAAAAAAPATAPAPEAPATAAALAAEPAQAAAPAAAAPAGGTTPEAPAAEATPAPDPTQAAEPDGSPDASTPANTPVVDAEAAKAFEPVAAMVAQTVQATMTAALPGLLAEALGPMEERVKALEGTRDEQVAAAIRPRVGPSYVPNSAAQSPNTAMKAEDVPKVVTDAVETAEKAAGDPPAPTGIDMYLQSIRNAAANGVMPAMMDTD